MTEGGGNPSPAQVDTRMSPAFELPVFLWLQAIFSRLKLSNPTRLKIVFFLCRNGFFIEVLQSVIVPGVTSGDCDGEERASTRRPSMTLAVILLIQLQLLATLSLAKDENKEHVMWEFVKSLR